MDYNTFLNYFPEFENKTHSEIETAIEKADLSSNGYAGIDDTKKRALAIGLHAAHSLAIGDRQAKGDAGVVTEMKSRHDEIKFAVSEDMAGFGYSSTTYGKSLEALLASEVSAGLLI